MLNADKNSFGIAKLSLTHYCKNTPQSGCMKNKISISEFP